MKVEDRILKVMYLHYEENPKVRNWRCFQYVVGEKSFVFGSSPELFVSSPLFVR